MRTLFLLPLAGLLACHSNPAPNPTPAVDSGPFQAGSPWPKFRGNLPQTGQGAIHRSSTGGEQWSFATGSGIFSSPIVGADGTIYFGSADQNFYALAPDGGQRWKIETGEIIDSSGLLDNQGHVYFGSGDGILRAADAQTGQIAWTFAADAPSDGAYINWFEGNVAIALDGTLYVPNDNFFVYAINRDTGAEQWKDRMPDQTWSLPAVDAESGQLFIGNNNLTPLLGDTIFALGGGRGTVLWSTSTLGTVAASPLLTGDGQVVVGGFDGYFRSYSEGDGGVLWEVATRDHIYASPAQLPNGTLVQASVDGTVYAVSPGDGSPVWSLDLGTPLRSSPAVDADGDIYVGGGDGRLYVINPDGSLRFAMLLIDDVRNDLNASPALGSDAVYIGGESGEMFSVPYDWCLRAANASDPRCLTALPTQADGASLVWVNPFGDIQPAVPPVVDGNAPVILQLVVRSGGAQQLAILDSASVQATVQPPTPVSVAVSGDGRFLSVTPTLAFAPGTLSIEVQASYLVDLDRTGLAVSGGVDGGSVQATVATSVASPSGGSLSPTAIYELSRVSIPLPTVMPSYNQIGFDQLHYLLGVAEEDGGQGVAWMVGGILPPDGGKSVVDPNTQAVFPMAFALAGDLATFSAAEGLQVSIMNYTLALQTFRVGARFQADGTPSGTAELSGSALCADLGLYGGFLEQLGLCNPQTNTILVLGATNDSLRTDLAPPPPAGTAVFSMTADAIIATLTGSQVQVSQHLAGLLVVDAQTGLPVTLDYGVGTTRTAAPDGTLESVSVPTTGMTLPQLMTVYLMIDTTPAASGSLVGP